MFNTKWNYCWNEAFWINFLLQIIYMGKVTQPLELCPKLLTIIDTPSREKNHIPREQFFTSIQWTACNQKQKISYTKTHSHTFPSIYGPSSRVRTHAAKRPEDKTALIINDYGTGSCFWHRPTCPPTTTDVVRSRLPMITTPSSTLLFFVSPVDWLVRQLPRGHQSFPDGKECSKKICSPFGTFTCRRLTNCRAIRKFKQIPIPFFVEHELYPFVSFRDAYIRIPRMKLLFTEDWKHPRK